MTQQQPIAITYGDPAGIGPDLVLQLPRYFPDQALVVIGDIDVLAQRAHLLNIDVTLAPWEPNQSMPTGALAVWHTPVPVEVVPGQPDPRLANSILTMLNRAIDGCLNHTFSAMVTAPLAKSVVCDGADPNFTGHTEYLAERSSTDRVVMMLATDSMRVALATTHLPLREVADAITHDDLQTTLQILQADLIKRFHIASPKILVLGLNPHAGEDGHLGMEEIEVITPALNELREQGFTLTGPVPADTAFNQQLLSEHHAVLAMFHDQGLPVLKYAGFGNAVNITLGLPFLRTSVDHGTAFPLAGTGQAKVDSLVTATNIALQQTTNIKSQ